MSGGASNWFALVDTAQDPQLFGLVLQSAQQQCLVTGQMSPVLAAALPYVVKLEDKEPLSAAWQANGAGNNWGFLFQSALPIDKLRVHFKKFLYAQLPDGTVALFRFYDPRVFRTYLSAASPGERLPWFEGVDRYWVESATPGLYHDFHIHGGELYDSAAPAAPPPAQYA